MVKEKIVVDAHILKYLDSLLIQKVWQWSVSGFTYFDVE